MLKLQEPVVFCAGGVGGVSHDVKPTLEGSTFTFKIVINPEETVTISVKLAGDKFEGKFTGKASGTGTFNGKKQA